MLKNYFKIAARHIKANKLFSIINIFGLMLGFYCVTLIYSWISFETSYDKFHKNSECIQRVAFTNENKEFFGTYQPGPLADHLKDVIPEIIYSTSYSEMNWSVSHNNKNYSIVGSFAKPDFFKMFSFPFVAGVETNFSTDHNSIVITQKLAKKIFGDKDPISESIEFSNKSFKVVGILKDIPKNSSLQFEALIPFENAPKYMKLWNIKSTTTYAMLSSANSVGLVNKKISDIMDQHNPEWNNILYLSPLNETHLYNLEGGGLITYIYIFALLGLTILAIACINFVNLTTAYSQNRKKEIGMRKTIGASKFSIQVQFLLESVIFALVSMVFSLFLVDLTLPYLNIFLGKTIIQDFSFNFIVILFLFSLFIGLTAGAYPAIVFSRVESIKILASSARTGTGGHSSKLRRILVTTQFALTIFFIITLFGIQNQLTYIKNKNLGYSSESLLMVRTQGELRNKVPEIKKRLLAETNIKNVSVSGNDIISLSGTGSGTLDWPNKVSEKIVEAGINIVDYDFVETMGMKISQGRFFSKEYNTDMQDAIVINEEAVRQMELTDPIGKKITFNQGNFNRSGKIIGIIKDFHAGSLHEAIYPVVMWPAQAANFLIIKISSKDIERTINTIETIMSDFVSFSQFDYQFFSDKIEQQYKIEKLTSNLILYISILMLIISCLGLFALTSITTQQREKEIGIRKVLGASVSVILKLLGREYILLIAAANIIAYPLAYITLDNWLNNFSYRVEISLIMFLIAGGLSLSVALFTLSWKVIKAALSNPVESLRNE